MNKLIRVTHDRKTGKIISEKVVGEIDASKDEKEIIDWLADRLINSQKSA